jgi:hypothetical protein
MEHLRQPKPCRLVGKMLRALMRTVENPASGVRFRAMPPIHGTWKPGQPPPIADLAPLIPNSHSDTLAG